MYDSTINTTPWKTTEKRPFSQQLLSLRYPSLKTYWRNSKERSIPSVGKKQGGEPASQPAQQILFHIHQLYNQHYNQVCNQHHNQLTKVYTPHSAHLPLTHHKHRTSTSHSTSQTQNICLIVQTPHTTYTTYTAHLFHPLFHIYHAQKCTTAHTPETYCW